MNPDPHRLPSWARRVLEWALPGGVRGASIRGDLGEEWGERPPGPTRTTWLVLEVIRLVFHYRIRPVAGGGGGMGGGTGVWRFALRRMAKDPGFSVLAILTTALGIGATVALFSVVQAVLLDPLPYRSPDDLVAVFEAHRPREISRNVANPGNVAAWRGVRALEGAEAVVLAQPRVVSQPGEPREVMSSIVTPGYLELLGVDLAEGTGFTPAAGAGDGNQVVLTRDGWNELFGGTPGAVGQSVVVNGQSARVVGVLPPTHLPFADGALLLMGMPLEAMGDQTNTGRFLNVVARLAPGSAVDAARLELEGVMAGLREAHPDFNAGWDVEVESLRAVVLGDLQAPLWTLLAAGSLLLLVACVNVANLTLARATERQAEMAVRSALGASGGRLAGQLVVESLLLAGVGGVVGVGLAWVATRVLTPGLLEAFALPRLGDVGLDGSVLAFAAAVTTATGLVFGLAPAWGAVRRGPAETLGAEGRGPSRRTGRLRRGLVVAEVALSVMLLTSAGLLVRSFRTLAAVDTGFEAERVVTGRINLTGERYRGAEPDLLFYADLETRLAALPGVEAFGGVSFLPLDGLGSATSYYPADRPVPPRDQWSVADIRPVVGDYFGAMGIERVAGRTFEATDDADSPRVIVVNRSLAEEAWPGEDPLGRPLAINWSDLEPWTVVGVVDDVVHTGMDQAPRPMVYHTLRQAPYFSFMTLALRTRAGDVAGAVAGLRSAVAAIDPAVPVTRVRAMDDLVRTATARPRMTAFLVTLFAGAAAALAAVGLYGVLAFAVARRVREIGVRMALGARATDVVALVTGQGLRLVALGLVLGLGGAALGSRVFEALLFGITAHDPWAFAAAGALFAVVGTAASVIPALRAVRILPGRALREE